MAVLFNVSEILLFGILIKQIPFGDNQSLVLPPGQSPSGAAPGPGCFTNGNIIMPPEWNVGILGLKKPVKGYKKRSIHHG